MTVRSAVGYLKMRPAFVVLAALLQSSDAGAAPPVKTYAECQRKTPNPLSGCPPGTLLVSKDSSGVNFTTIQAAIASLPNDDSEHVILITSGTYTEQLNVTRSGPLTLLGISEDPYQGIPYASVQSDTDHSNLVQVIWSAANNDSTGKGVDNAVTSVLTVAPTWNASLTGSGPTGFPVPENTPFGNANFRAYNIDFRNVFSDRSAGPALAVGVSYANAGFYGCGFYSYQDTVYVGKLGNAFFYDCVVAGQTDFLYGFGTAWLERSTLALRNCGGGITAWKGTNTTFVNKYGVYTSDSRVIAANDTIAPVIEGKCPLGRPWNAQHRSIFMISYLDGSILPAGYIEWYPNEPRVNNSTLMAVYNDYGPGFDEVALEASNVTVVMDEKSVQTYRTPADVFMDPAGEHLGVSWIDPQVRQR